MPNHCNEHYPGQWFGTFFGDLFQSEELSEIKHPVVTWLFNLFSVSLISWPLNIYSFLTRLFFSMYFQYLQFYIINVKFKIMNWRKIKPRSEKNLCLEFEFESWKIAGKKVCFTLFSPLLLSKNSASNWKRVKVIEGSTLSNISLVIYNIIMTTIKVDLGKTSIS